MKRGHGCPSVSMTRLQVEDVSMVPVIDLFILYIEGVHKRLPQDMPLRHVSYFEPKARGPVGSR